LSKAGTSSVLARLDYNAHLEPVRFASLSLVPHLSARAIRPGLFFGEEGRSVTPTDELIREVLSRVRTIAVVGFSANPLRPSHGVARYLASRGYRVIPVNPGLAGQEFLGQEVAASLADIREPVDMVDVFRRSPEVSVVTDQALALSPLPFALWTQLGVRDDEAAARAEAAGMRVVQDRCPAIEIPRLGIALPR
jgi:predicted CoA-binding protein